MKKFLPYILIIVIVANIFAPFSLFFKQKNSIRVEENRAEATGILKFEIKQTSNTDTTITLKTSIEIEEPTVALSGYEILEEIVLKDRSGIEVHRHEFDLQKNGGVLTQTKTKDGTTLFEGSYTIDKLKPAESYTLYPSLKYVVHVSDLFSLSDTYEPDPLPTPLKVNTYDPQNPDSGLEKNFQEFQSGVGALPQCGFSPVTDEGTIAGCGVQILYYGVFIPTSYLFGLAGKFFDATFGYSIQDSSYRSGFVTEGWAIVRDFCNLFFIFVLIYAAFGMILSIHSIKSKEIIINTIIIGLLINFSLLAGQILIDTSNILARVFYNSEAIKITVDQQGKPVTRGGVNMYDTTMGELPLSAALVNKIEPQALIIEASRTQVGDDVKKIESGADSTDLGIGAYFLVILLAIIINIIGTFVFISVGLIFVARVIGLWFALIFAPLAFFSYTVPQMQGIAMVGWKKWWPETMGLAFLAPIFMFFMYLILVFLERGFVSLLEASDGPNFVLSIIIPFAFIMILLMTAKKLAKSYSGQMGQMITGAVTATGAALLGGAALGAAFIGRRTIGSFMKGSATGETSVQRFARGDSKGTWDRIKGGALHYGTLGLANRAQIATGRYINHDKHRVHEISEGRHLLDETAGQMFHGQKFDSLGVDERAQVRNRMDLNDMIRNRVVVHVNGQPINYGSRKNWSEMTNDERTALEDALNTRLTSTTRQQRRDPNNNLDTETFAERQETNARRKQSLGSTLLQSSATGSYDVRNLSKLISKEFQHGITKMGIGIISTIALGMRMGLKQGAGINHGTGQGDFFKDLGHTITEAMKAVKIEVPKGGGGGHDDHGGGHDDHGHGGGGGGHH